MTQNTPQPVGPSPIQRILLCNHLTRPDPDLRNVCSSLPGHLIQLTLTGQNEHIVNGRKYLLKPGHLIWYHEDEEVRIHTHKAPWSLYTLNFIAPALSPPAYENRVRSVGVKVKRQFACVLDVWRETTVRPEVRQLHVHGQVLKLLAMILGGSGETFSMDPAASIWWEREIRLREQLHEPINLAIMVQMTGRSQATLARACQAATGLPPMKRIKQIRLSLARGWVCRSDASISEIAYRVGYGRVHEFSRDFKKQFGRSPTDCRREFQ